MTQNFETLPDLLIYGTIAPSKTYLVKFGRSDATILNCNCKFDKSRMRSETKIEQIQNPHWLFMSNVK